mmetsp:Transcript_6602/g.11398  ORF Transcript_6602/g.11398 Transcript_6602/m.11398 type:complete len:586 (+) Transcript_6602:116-1873(+)
MKTSRIPTIAITFLVVEVVYPFVPLLTATQKRRGTTTKTILLLSAAPSYDDGNNNGESGGSSWSVADDWNALSEANIVVDTSIVFDGEYAKKVADEMVAESPPTEPLSEDDVWIRDIVDEIHNAFSTLDDQPLYDTSFDEPSLDDEVVKEALQNDMGNEIAMLIRCNEAPESMLIAEGRALAPLTIEEKNDVSQLVVLTQDSCMATDFLKNAVSNIFLQHAVKSPFDGVLSMDRAAIASWMTKSLQEEGEGKVSPHDKRVLKTLSDFSSYGSGRLVEENLQELYLFTIVGDVSNLSSISPKRHFQLRKPFVDAVWRDIRAHGIISPVEEERLGMELKIRADNREMNPYSSGGTKSTKMDIVDECEILDWGFQASETTRSGQSQEKQQGRRSSSRGSNSHKLIEMADDNKTPLWMRDGEFVFIDEESCIGCAQCSNVAPSSFVMLDSGRARTFHQRSGPDIDQAVEACPVACMHHVSYQELKEFETARDEGDGRTDHRHLGKAHTPLHVAGIDSDNNHRSSWYHTLKQKCLVSSECPQKGCYDCPKYSVPGGNPFFKEKQKHAEHVRATHFIENGDVDAFRKAAEL